MIRTKSFLLLALSAGLPSFLLAQPTAHYAPGTEGCLAPSLPPPGLYLRDYNLFYTADQLNNGTGFKALSAKVFTYAQAPRVIWISDTKFLGADVGADALLPIEDTHLKIAPLALDSTTFGIGDLYGEGLLAWHLKRFDFAFSAGMWAPTGNSAPPPTTRAGLDYWTGMLTWGATWFIDTNKTWAVSALNRYEFNSEQRNTDTTRGQAYTLEWGVSKQVMPALFVGAAGYYQGKVTSDSGPAAAPKDRVAGAGPEIGGTITGIKLLASVRYAYEFMAENRAQGQTVTLTLTKRF